MAKTYTRNSVATFRHEIDSHPLILDFLRNSDISYETIHELKMIDMQTSKALKKSKDEIIMDFKLSAKSKAELNVFRQKVDDLADKVSQDFAKKSEYYESFFGVSNYPKRDVIKSIVRDKINNEIRRRKNSDKSLRNLKWVG